MTDDRFACCATLHAAHTPLSPGWDAGVTHGGQPASMRSSPDGKPIASGHDEIPTRPRREPLHASVGESGDLTDLSRYLMSVSGEEPGGTNCDVAPPRVAHPERSGPERLGDYYLLATIGQGGMSEVYLAAARRPGGFTKLLVIKELRASLARDPEFLDMFLAEAQLAARLQHPNVVQTYEVGSSGGRYFIAMEYLEGQPLHQILSLGSERGGLGLAARLTVLAEMLDGLHYAHEATDYDGAELGIIHRDVSPHNVIVTYQGGVKIMDFGVAKVAHDHHHTMAGVLKGKLGYMSPEQARGEPVDRRADLFSVGVMLWECVTEHRMWEGLTELELLRRLGDGDLPSLQAVMPNVPVPPTDCLRTTIFAPSKLQRSSNSSPAPRSPAMSTAKVSRVMPGWYRYPAGARATGTGEACNRASARLPNRNFPARTRWWVPTTIIAASPRSGSLAASRSPWVIESARRR